MNKLKKSSYYWLTPLITLVILIITYIIKGVYPFGSSNIAYYDLGQQYSAFYARNNEILNGNESLIFSWLSGAGTDMSGALPSYIVSPFGWLTFFVKSGDLLNFLGLFLIIKLMCASLTISVFTKKSYELPLPIHTALCLMYTFSGYVVQHYTNIFFLDSMVLFPLIILAMKHMKNKGREWPYMLLVAAQLMMSPYLSIMTLLFLLFYSFGLMVIEKDKTVKKEFAARVGLYTFAGAAIAGIVFLPAVFKWNATVRTQISGENNISTIIGQAQNDFFNQKAFMTFNTELAAAFLILAVASLIIRKKKPSGDFVFHVYMFVLMVMPILFEGSLLVWHMGSYVHFPYRNGYMFAFAALELAAYQYSHSGELSFKRENSDKSKSKKPTQSAVKRNRIIMGVLAGICTAASIVMLVILDTSFMQYGIHFGHGSYTLAPFIYLLNIAAYALILCIGVEKLKQIFIMSLVTVNAAVTSAGFIAPYEYAPDDDYSFFVTRDSYIKDASALRSEADLQNDSISRVKLLDTSLSMNYAYYLGMPTISQWTGEVVSDVFLELCSLGYDNAYTGNMDSGGTVFSDALLNDKKLITYKTSDVSDKLYSNEQKYGDYSIYDINYTLPFGMLTDEKVLSVETADLPVLKHQEQVYEAFAADNDELITFIDEDAEELPPENENYACTYKLTAHIDEPSVIYAYLSFESEMYVNGEKMTFPYFDQKDNEVYPRYMLSGIVSLGVFDEGDVEIKINTNDKKDYIYDYQKMSVGVLNLNVLEKLCKHYESSCISSYQAGKNSLKMTADVEGNNYLFLPIQFLEGWKADVNGESAEILPVLGGAFCAIKLPNGHCDISMKYLPTNYLLGAALTAIGVAAAVFLLLMKKLGKDICSVKFINKTAYVLFCAVSIMLLIIANVDPPIARFVNFYRFLIMKLR